MQVVVDSLLTHYEQSGHGKRCVVLVHGWGDNLQTFKQLQAFLSMHYTVIALDLPGLGSSQAPVRVWGLDEYARFLQQFLVKVDHSKPYAIIGHSNGGAIAIRGLGKKILNAQKLVLLSSAGIRDVKRVRRVALKVIAKVGKAATRPLPRKTRTRIRRKFYGSIGSDLLVVEHMQATFKKVVSQDVQADALNVRVPALLLYGRGDTDTPPEYGKMLTAKLPEATFHQIEHAGHFIHHDKPALIHDMIGDFLA